MFLDLGLRPEDQFLSTGPKNVVQSVGDLF